MPSARQPIDPKRHVTISGASGNNLQNVELMLPLGLLTCVTGVSGSGKSTLINGTLYPLAATALNGATTLKPAAHDSIEGLEQLDKCIDIDQSPIGRTPRSNPATYTGIFTPIRELFAGTQEARSRGYKPGRFSFNVRGGRCEACQGDGVTKVEMHFLPDIYVPCDVCKGKRYNRETLEIKFKDLNISEVLNLTVEDALGFFEAVPAIHRKLQTLMDVGSLTFDWARPPPRSPAAKRSASSCRASSPSAIPVAHSISSTNPPPACTLKIFASCWRSFIACGMAGTRW